MAPLQLVGHGPGIVRALKSNTIRGQPPRVSIQREALDRMTYVMRLLRLIPCTHRHVYVAGSLRICEECDTVWRLLQ
jgi:hypothetical protein